MLNPLKIVKKVLQRPILQNESAPASETAGIAVYLDAYTNLISNQDTVLMAKGYGDLKIYQEVLRDDQVKSTFQQRRLAVVAKDLIVEAGLKVVAMSHPQQKTTMRKKRQKKIKRMQMQNVQQRKLQGK